MITNPNATAFPATPEQLAAKSDGQIPGLSKRELFAAMAMQGILSGDGDDGEWVVGGKMLTFHEIQAHIGMISVQYAEALIAALNKTQ